MPHPTRGIPRDKAYHVKANANIAYGFKTKDENVTGVTESDLTSQLGWTPFNASDGGSVTLVVFGANAPKPPRVTKRLAGNRSFSGFCSYDKFRDALNIHGWTFSKQGKLIASGGGPIKRLVAVNLTNPSGSAGTTLYGFLLRRDDIELYPGFISDLGIDLTLGDGALKRMVMGTNRPRPGKAKTRVTNEGPLPAGVATSATFTSFYDPSKEDSLFTVNAEGIAKWQQVKAPLSF